MTEIIIEIEKDKKLTYGVPKILNIRLMINFLTNL